MNRLRFLLPRALAMCACFAILGCPVPSPNPAPEFSESAGVVRGTSDGGIVLVGRWRGDEQFLMKTDSAGNEVWSRTLPDSRRLSIHVIREAPDGGYLLYGGKGGEDILIKTDLFGKILWTLTFRDRYRGFNDIDLTPSGEIVLVGTQRIAQGTLVPNRLLLGKVDSEGRVLWIRIIDNEKFPEGVSIAALRDGGMAISVLKPLPDRDFDSHLVRVNDDGAILWTRDLMKNTRLGVHEDAFGNIVSRAGVNLALFSPAGDLIWSSILNSSHASVLAAANGDFTISTGSHFTRLNNSGTILWEEIYPDRPGEMAETTTGATIFAGGLNVGESHSGPSYVHIVSADPGGLEQWANTFGTVGGFGAESIVEVSDGGFVIAGNLVNAEGNRDMVQIRTDATGTEQWRSSFGQGSDDKVSDIVRVTDGNVVLVGTGVDDTGERFQFGVVTVKTDLAGNELWRSVHPITGSRGPSRSFAAAATSDGGIISVGAAVVSKEERVFPLIPIGIPRTVFDFFVIKTDALGNTAWTRNFGGLEFDVARAVTETSDGGFVIAGQTARELDFSTDKLREADITVTKTDSAGKPIWTTRSHHTFGDDRINAVIETGDGDLLFVGSTTSFGRGDQDVYLLKLRADGSTLWDTTFGGEGTDIANDIVETADGGYAITGSTSQFAGGLADLLVMKADADGVLMWSTSEFTPNRDTGNKIIETSDGFLVVAGDMRPFGIDRKGEWFLAKYDSDGNRTLLTTFE